MSDLVEELRNNGCDCQCREGVELRAAARIEQLEDDLLADENCLAFRKVLARIKELEAELLELGCGVDKAHEVELARRDNRIEELECSLKKALQECDHCGALMPPQEQDEE